MANNNGNNGQWWAPPKLPRFSGELVDGPAEDFVEEATRVFRTYRVEDPVGVEFLLRHLHGQAKREVLSRPDGDVDTPDKILNVIQATFGDSRPVAMLMSRFHGQQQHSSQTVLGYSQALYQCFRRVNEQQPGSINGMALRDRFIEGLASAPLRRELRRRVREGLGVTFHDVREEALRWTREEDGDNAEERQPLIQQHLLTPVPTPEVQELRGEISALRQAVTKIQSTLESLLQKQVQGNAQMGNGQSPAPAPVPRCLYCQRRGHHIRDCRKRKADQTASRRQNQGQQGQQASN